MAAQQPAQHPALPTPTESINVFAEPVPAASLAATVTTLDRAAIEQTGATDAAELLRFVAVVHLSQNGSRGSLSTISLRSAKPNFTLVLIDGVPVNDIGDELGGSFNFATLSLDDIERIDIIRGPLSSLYGSEAVGGVISITLRPASAAPAWHSATEAGNFGEVIESAGVSATVDKIGVAASGGVSRMGQQVLDDGFLLGTASVRADSTLSTKTHADSFIRWNRLSSTGFPISSGGPLYAVSRAVEIDQADQLIGGASLQHQPNGRWTYALGYDVFSRVALNNTPAIFDTVPPGPSYVPSTYSDTRFLRQRVMTAQQIQLARWFKVYAAGSFRSEHGASTGNLAGYLPASYTLSRPTGSFSGNAAVTHGPLAATAGLGVDKSNTYRTVLSPRVGGSYTFGASLLRGSWGKGFKLPSFYSLGNPLVGNPALTPEFSTGYDAGIEHTFPRPASRVSLTVFNTNFRDLVDFSPALFKLVNRRQSFARGAELKAGSSLHGVSLGGAVSYLDAGFRQTAERLRDVPRWSEDIHALVPLSSALKLQVSTVWIGRRFDYQVPVPQLDTVSRYSVTNMKLAWHVREDLDTYVRLENLFDSKYQEFVGFPNPGIYAAAGIVYSSHGRRP